MLSKLFRPCGQMLVAQAPRLAGVRSSKLLPASQYDMAVPKKFKLGYALSTYWELIPLFFVTTFALSLMVAAFFWAANNKVDAVFSVNSRRNISRTMNLRMPSVHKIVIIYQRYEPWPEMQDVLDKMAAQEKRLQMQADICVKK